MEYSTEELIDFLRLPAHFPDQPKSVRIIQTHASVLALTEKWVYKFKKALNLGFLDFTSLERRKFFCEEELRLNRRLAADIYQGLQPLYFDAQSQSLSFQASSSGTVIDYAVKMRRMKEEGFLSLKILSPDYQTPQLTLLWQKLSNFYPQLPALKPEDPHWLSKNIQESVRGNIDRSQDWGDRYIPSINLQYLQKYTLDFLEQNQALFRKRQLNEKIKEGHGDLRSEHIYIENQKIYIYDCIEFNTQFRQIDLLNDLAFLMMDFEYLQRVDLASYIENKCWQDLESHPEPELLNFYKSYRAWVRAKVNVLKAQESEMSVKQKNISTQKAKDYLALASQYAILGPQLVLIVVNGGPASGKSTLAKCLGQHLQLNSLHSDEERKKHFNVDLYARSPKEQWGKIYSKASRQTIYAKMLQKAHRAFQKSRGLIIDATFQEDWAVKMLSDWSKAHQVRVMSFETWAPPEVIHERLKKREHEKVISDMRLDVYKDHLLRTGTLQNSFPSLQINTQNSLSEGLSKIYDFSMNEAHKKNSLFIKK